MVWLCQRGCGAGGRKRYQTAAQARHFAAAFDREDNQELGRRAPLFGLFPLRVWRYLRHRSDGTDQRVSGRQHEAS